MGTSFPPKLLGMNVPILNFYSLYERALKPSWNYRCSLRKIFWFSLENREHFGTSNGDPIRKLEKVLFPRSLKWHFCEKGDRIWDLRSTWVRRRRLVRKEEKKTHETFVETKNFLPFFKRTSFPWPPHPSSLKISPQPEETSGHHAFWLNPWTKCPSRDTHWKKNPSCRIKHCINHIIQRRLRGSPDQQRTLTQQCFWRCQNSWPLLKSRNLLCK